MNYFCKQQYGVIFRTEYSSFVILKTSKRKKKNYHTCTSIKVWECKGIIKDQNNVDLCDKIKYKIKLNIRKWNGYLKVRKTIQKKYGNHDGGKRLQQKVRWTKAGVMAYHTNRLPAAPNNHVGIFLSPRFSSSNTASCGLWEQQRMS